MSLWSDQKAIVLYSWYFFRQIFTFCSYNDDHLSVFCLLPTNLFDKVLMRLLFYWWERLRFGLKTIELKFIMIFCGNDSLFDEPQIMVKSLTSTIWGPLKAKMFCSRFGKQKNESFKFKHSKPGLYLVYFKVTATLQFNVEANKNISIVAFFPEKPIISP